MTQQSCCFQQLSEIKVLYQHGAWTSPWTVAWFGVFFGLWQLQGLHIQEALEKGLKDREVQQSCCLCQHHHQAGRKVGVQEGVKTWTTCSKEVWLLKGQELPILIHSCQVLLHSRNREKSQIVLIHPQLKKEILAIQLFVQKLRGWRVWELLLSNGVCIRAERASLRPCCWVMLKSCFIAGTEGTCRAGVMVAALGMLGSYKDHRFLWSPWKKPKESKPIFPRI